MRLVTEGRCVETLPRRRTQTDGSAALRAPDRPEGLRMPSIREALGRPTLWSSIKQALHFALLLGTLACEARDPATNPMPALSGPTSDSGPDRASASLVPGTRPLRVSTGRSAKHGSYLTDSGGRALYVLAQDPKGTTSCYDACATVWPPFLASGGVPTAASSAVKQALLTTIARRDGEIQVAYDGRPLYYDQGDDERGQTNGHHVQYTWGEWWLMSPDGLTTHQSPERQPRR